jgi:hypothetical protein
MKDRRDFYVYDEFGDVWNVEPLNTHHDACDFRYYISKRINSPRTLLIRSVAREPREIVVMGKTRGERIREHYAEESDF